MTKQMVSCGFKWNVLEKGSGPDTVVFLPGTLGSVEIFENQIQDLSRYCRVVVLGYPGTNRLASLSESFWRLLGVLQVEQPYLAGSSLGAYLLQHFTSESTHGVQGLLLGNTFVDSHRLRFIRMFDPAFIDQAAKAEVKGKWLDFVSGLKSDLLRSKLMPMVRDQQTDEELQGRSFAIAHLGLVAPSVLPPSRISILSCDDDPVCAPSVTAEVVASYAGARHIRLATGAHYPHLINSAEYNQGIRSAFPDLALNESGA